MLYLPVDKKTVSELSERLQYTSDGIEKTIRLYNLMNAIHEDAVLCSSVALKGGTALNLLIFPRLPRMSEDIDLDLCGDDVISKDMALAKLNNEILPRMKDIAEAAGYEAHVPEREYYGLSRLFLPYQTLSGGMSKIKLEINYISRIHVLPVNQVHLYSTVLGNEVFMTTLNAYEIMAEKICAMYERCAPRDLFDINTFSKSIAPKYPDINECLRSVTIFHAALHGLDKETLMNPQHKMDSLSFSDYRSGLLPMIRKGYGFIDTAQIQEETNIFLTNLFSGITKKEEEFLQKYFQGEYRPELLFDNPSLAMHPKALFDMRSRQPGEDPSKGYDPWN